MRKVGWVRGVVAWAVLLGCGVPPADAGLWKHHGFASNADAALQAMRAKATELKIGGAAVVAYFEGDNIASWQSEMLVVDHVQDAPAAGNSGNNLLAIAYAKASEMALTLKNSGSGVRPKMTGELGWTGGVIARGKHGWVVAAFSGGKSEDDVQVSRAGVERLRKGL